MDNTLEEIAAIVPDSFCVSIFGTIALAVPRELSEAEREQIRREWFEKHRKPVRRVLPEILP